MVKINCNYLTDKGILLFTLLVCAMPQIGTAEILSAEVDCSTVGINYTENSEWTNDERLEAMDKAFFESVDRFELCNLSNKSGGSSSSGSESAQASNSSEGAQANSTESSTLKGTEESESTEMSEIESTEVSNNTSLSKNTNSKQTMKSGGRQINGSQPKDIPNANNDDVIAAQIRLAAEIEQDPVKKKKLWNEYRKYKGMAI